MIMTSTRPTVWLLLCTVLFFAISQNVLSQGGPNPLSPRYTLYAIPAAISLLRGYPHDYTAQMEDAGPFIFQSGDTNNKIKQRLTMKPGDNSAIWYVSGDDKGLIDLTYAAFIIFGPILESISKAVLLLIGLSVLLYVLQFRRQDAPMAALASLLCGLYGVLFTFGLTDQSGSIAEPRFLGVIAVFSSMHLMLLSIGQQRLSWLEWLIAAAQLCILVFVIHLRSSELWQLIAICVFAIAAIVLRVTIWRRALLIVLLPLLGLGALTIYRHATLNPRYLDSDLSTRVFWHNALIGLSINPVLREKYGFTALRDDSITEAVRRRMIGENRRKAATALFPSDYLKGNFANFDWRSYEVEARSMYIRIFSDNLKEVLHTYAFLAPTLIIEELEYLSGKSFTEDISFGGVEQFVSTAERAEKDLFFSLLRPIPVAAMLAVCAMLLTARADCAVPHAAIVAMFVLSLIPPILATPAIQYIQLPLLLGVALIYFAAAGCSAAVARLLIKSSRSYGPF
jgi:hypothetical protein